MKAPIILHLTSCLVLPAQPSSIVNKPTAIRSTSHVNATDTASHVLPLNPSKNTILLHFNVHIKNSRAAFYVCILAHLFFCGEYPRFKEEVQKMSPAAQEERRTGVELGSAALLMLMLLLSLPGKTQNR